MIESNFSVIKDIYKSILQTRVMESESSEKPKLSSWFGVRHLFVFLGELRVQSSEFRVQTGTSLSPGFLGFANVYAMRVNLSVAIVYMSGEKNMDWDESRQGFILGDLDFTEQGWVDSYIVINSLSFRTK